MSFQSIKSNRIITRLFPLSFLVAALAILLSAQAASAQCVESPTGETAVGLRNASSHFLVFYLDDVNKGGVPPGDQSVDFFVWPGEHTLRAEARIGDETLSVTRKVLIPVGYVCTWTVTDPQKTNPGIQGRVIGAAKIRSHLLKQKPTAVINLAVPN